VSIHYTPPNTPPRGGPHTSPSSLTCGFTPYF